MTPNKKSCQFAGQGNPPGIKEATLFGATSFHSGGVNGAMLDGSVRFIKDKHLPGHLGRHRYQGRRRSHQL